MSFHVVIPARFASSRLPGKPLRELAGRPMILHTIDRALTAGAARVIVATDDERIQDTVRLAGVDCMMTRADHETGSDRLAEVVDLLGCADDQIVVNLQGDEPLMPPGLLGTVAARLSADTAAGVATLATPIHTVDELFDPNVVKVVTDAASRALYFSRAPIPFVRDVFALGMPASLPPEVPFLRHLGIYAYRAGTLRRFARLPPAKLELGERLEQLRLMEAGVAVALDVIDEAPACGVDTEDDLTRAEAALSAIGGASAEVAS
jgi:3-deoxy-manno-octulosonate cytidylyltransferase (CMP-KDO synthetase)